jgi:hypothetical protein
MAKTTKSTGIKAEQSPKVTTDGKAREAYNVATGRHPQAPLVGGPMGRGKNRHPRGRAPGAPSAKRVSVEYLG